MPTWYSKSHRMGTITDTRDEQKLNTPPPPTYRQKSRWRGTYILGIISLIMVVVFWVGSSFITADILQTYPKPFFMCYLTNLTFIIYFIFWVIDDPVQSMMRRQSEQDTTEQEALPESGNPISVSVNQDTIIKHHELAPFTKSQLAKIAFVFFTLYLASNYATNMAFEKTSVSSASILAATCGFFTLVFGWVMGVEVLSIMRILAVLISVGGVLVLGVPEFLQHGSKATGNAFALIGAVFYGIFSIFLKRVAIDESRISMPILFAFGGLYTLLLAWPILWGLHYWEIETFMWPQSSKLQAYIAINVILGGFVPNYLWNVAFVCTSPLVVAIGISFTIPLTLLVSFIRGEPVDAFRICSGMLVVVGFVIVNLANIYPQWDLQAERLLVKLGLMKEADLKTTEERAAKQRSDLIEAARE